MKLTIWLCPKFVFIILIFVLFSGIAYSEVAVLVDRSTHKNISNNFSNDIPAAWFLVFMADGGSLTGHAYVTWGRENPEALRSEQFCFGMYAKNSEKKKFYLGE